MVGIRLWMFKGSLVVLTLTGCTEDKDAGKVEEPVVPAASAAEGKPTKEVKEVKAVAQPPADDPCKVLAKLPNDPPFYLTGKSIVLTRLMKPCVTRDGHRGFQKDTPWLAMGFPCTGGAGRIDIKGNYYNPKMV